MNAPRHNDTFGALSTLSADGKSYRYFSLPKLAAKLGLKLETLPYSIRVLLEAALRHCDGFQVTEADVTRLAGWTAAPREPVEIPFKPARVILQDFTGVPCVVDLAAMRDAVARLGGDASKINPLVPVDLVIDHSVQVDYFGTQSALERNAEIEFTRNRERYEFLRWGQKSFRNFRVVPPATGIVHQVNLEYLARGVMSEVHHGETLIFPDTLVGTDSHTTMINGLGVVGWGVGGIEAEAVMLGQPLYIVMPEVIGFKFTGQLREGVTATDLVLTVTQMLRKKGVVDKFVEFYGPGLANMSLADRATISNMAPEYGATTGFFPVDDETLNYMERTNRAPEAKLLKAYAVEQQLFRTTESPDPSFTETLSLDLGDVESCLAGPKRPQDRVTLRDMKPAFHKALTAPVKERGYGLAEPDLSRSASVGANGGTSTLAHGSVVIAAITSCTNTSNPAVMVAAGLLAQKAAALGLKVPAHVKTSLAPGSKVVTEYLNAAGLSPALDALGFNTVGYGCTSCIASGTPVLQSDGTARRIDDMPEAGGARLFGPGAEGRLNIAKQTEIMVRGARECVSLYLQDGRTLVCTPDHEILCSDGRWVRAAELKLGQDRVVVGLEAPLDQPAADEVDYSLQAGEFAFAMTSVDERLRSLAFARLVGHLLCDGSISVLGQGRINVGQAVDREVVLNDIERITGKRPAGSRYDERKWSIALPTELTVAICALDGVRTGQRIHQPARLPAFVLEPNCPVAIVREFLAGMFGADGWAPALGRTSSREESASLSPPAFSQSCLAEHTADLLKLMRDMLAMLARCGVKTDGAKLYDYPTRRAASSYPAARDGAPRVEVRLTLPDGLSFIEQVGYRYCVDKSLKATAAAVYWRMVGKIGEQRLWMADRLEARHREQPALTFSGARGEAATELLECEPELALSPVELFRQLGVRGWFAPLEARIVADKCYSVEKESLTLPTFSLQVIDRRPAGMRDVFDLAVDEVHAFVAGTVAVHNCIGNSGPLPESVSEAITRENLVAAAVLSGNRNFEGRVNPHTRANYLASPPLVVAYALAGTVDIDFDREPLGTGANGTPVYLRDVWPSHSEVRKVMDASIKPEQFATQYGNVFDGNPRWNAIPVGEGERYPWDPASTYIHEPPFFQGLTREPKPVAAIRGARCLVRLGDSVTTDHISPAGDIAEASPAGRYLKEHGNTKADFNSYGSRRGNDLVMVRGTFANIRLKNLLIPGSEGNVTVHQPSGESMAIFDAAERYRGEGVPLLVLAGKEYGSGSSRDWAAKGVLLLGVRAAIAESYERIHRSNLIGMGVLPLQYAPGINADSLGLTGKERFDIEGLDGALEPRMPVTVHAHRDDGSTLTFKVVARFDTPVEVEYYQNGGILQTVLRKLIAG